LAEGPLAAYRVGDLPMIYRERRGTGLADGIPPQGPFGATDAGKRRASALDGDMTSSGTSIPGSDPNRLSPAPPSDAGGSAPFSPSSSKSGKSQLVLFALVVLIGFLGVHRFYAGRIVSGVFQFLTLGGLGLWWIADVVIVALGRFNDRDGEFIRDKPRLTLIIAIAIALLGFGAGAALDPQIQRRVAGLTDGNVQEAYFAVARAEDAYFGQKGTYAKAFADLEATAGLVFDAKVNYENLKIYRDKVAQKECYSFTVRGASDAATAYRYDSCAFQTVTRLQ
jgi:hypothetical protein